jgi:hypothetical protein
LVGSVGGGPARVVLGNACCTDFFEYVFRSVMKKHREPNWRRLPLCSIQTAPGGISETLGSAAKPVGGHSSSLAAPSLLEVPRHPDEWSGTLRRRNIRNNTPRSAVVHRENAIKNEVDCLSLPRFAEPKKRP